jgi:pimeloyl-ACP methyl ester carboxylesterase
MKRTITLLACLILIACAQQPTPDSAHLNVYNTGDHPPLSIAQAITNANTTPTQAEAYRFTANNTTHSPVIMIPGLGLTPTIYTFTPDGRPGWAYEFTEAGYDVYAYNPARNANEGREWTREQAWTRWGIGPAYNETYNQTRFPTEQMKNFVATFPQFAAMGNHDVQLEGEAIRALLNLTGPAHVIAHSAGAPPVFGIAEHHPTMLESVVAIEPTGCPNKTNVPFLAIYGDYIEERGQTSRKQACSATVQHTANASMLDLPNQGIRGNSHVMMVDNNSDTIAARIQAWISRHE